METTIYYDTVSETINELAKRGYTTDFKVLAEEECLYCNKAETQLSPEEFEIDEIHRFEGDSDPGDEMIVFAISSKKHDIKGIIVNAYGMYSDPSTSKIIARLKKHIEKIKPIKRDDLLKPLSRDHHHSLLLCWKIRAGVKKEIETTRIKKYVDWFYETYALPHFELEEKYAFPILGNENELIKKALAEHKYLKELFTATTNIQNNLSIIEKELEKHIRFEEREVFNEVQKNATVEQLQEIDKNHSTIKFLDNTTDPFWE